MNSLQLNPAVVHELAAQLYWRRVHRDAVADIDQLVMTTAGEAILEPALIGEALAALQSSWGMADMTGDVLQRLKRAAAAEAFDRTRNELPLLGEVILDDALSGRSPGVESYVTPDAFNIVREVPAKIVESQAIPTFGKLVIRSPLPAVVISDTPPNKNMPIIRVPDTSALGVALALYLHVHAWNQIDDNQYLLTGNFLIPTKNSTQGRAWSRIIPNSTRFYRECTTCGMADGDLTISTTWLPAEIR